jgi:hypothetical protein
MLTVTLLDFSTGDLRIAENGTEVEVSGTEGAALVLAKSDETPVLLKRAYAGGVHAVTVGELRAQCELGWWGW